MGQTFLTVFELNVKVLCRIGRFIPGSNSVTINSPFLLESLLLLPYNSKLYWKCLVLSILRYLGVSFLYKDSCFLPKEFFDT